MSTGGKGNGGERATLDVENLRTGYATAVQMAIYDGGLSWQITGTFVQFAILMVAGAVFPTFVGSPQDNTSFAVTGFAVALAGLIMTCMFGSMVLRVRCYEEYWVRYATATEKRFGRDVQTFQGAAVLSQNHTITVGGNTLRLRRVCAVRSKTMLASLFICFLSAFFGLLLFNAYRIVVSL